MLQQDPDVIGVERAVLAGALLRPDLVSTAADLSPGDFSVEYHGEIWRSIGRAHPEVDLLTVELDLRERGVSLPGDWRQPAMRDVDAAHDAVDRDESPYGSWCPHPYLLALDEHLPDLSRWHRYVELVVEAWGNRELSQLRLADGDLSERIAAIKARVAEIERALPGGGSTTLGDVIAAGEDQPGDAGMLSTGLVDWDRVTLGLEHGDMAVVAGRPGHGKTALALSVVRNVAKAGHRVFFVSLEMTRGQLGQRLVAQESGVPLRKIRMGSFTPDEARRVEAAREYLATLPIHATEKAHTVAQIAAEAERLHSRHRELGLIVVDYLGLLKVPGRDKSEQERVAEASRDLRLLALERGVPLLALHQLNREIEHRGPNRRPQLSDLRSSGAVEQDASMVTFVVRPQLQYPEGTAEWREHEGLAELHVLKVRQGEAGRVVQVAFRGELTLFTDLYRRAA